MSEPNADQMDVILERVKMLETDIFEMKKTTEDILKAEKSIEILLSKIEEKIEKNV